MIDWFIANKEWFLSGIGIALPIAIISWFYIKKSKNQKQESGNNSLNLQAGKNLIINQSKLEKKNE